jgi:preprotein translocase subunit SecB
MLAATVNTTQASTENKAMYELILTDSDIATTETETKAFAVAVSTDDVFAVIQEELDEEMDSFPVIHGIAAWMYANAA